MRLIVLCCKNNCVVYIQYFIKGVLEKKKKRHLNSSFLQTESLFT